MTGTNTIIEDRIERLASELSQYPNYPFKAEASYFLGYYYFQITDYTRAVPAFNDALFLRIDLAKLTPVKRYLAQSEEHILRKRLLTTCWTSMYAVILIALAIGLKHRFWKSLSMQTVKTTGITLLCWRLVATALLLFLPSQSLPEGTIAEPAMINSTILQDGAQSLKLFLIYSTIGIVVSQSVTILVGSLKPRMVRIALNLALSMVIMSALTGVFYIKHARHTATLTKARLTVGLPAYSSTPY